MLYKLSIDHQVLAFFSHLSKRLVPNVAILSIAVGILVG
jgi:AAT family amino acid transporter